MKKIIFILTLFLSACIHLNAQKETKVSNDSIPASAKANIAEKFKGYAVANTVRTTDKKGNVIYKVETRHEVDENKTLIYYLVYNTEGKLLSKKKDKEIYYTSAPTKETNKEKGRTQKNPFPRY